MNAKEKRAEYDKEYRVRNKEKIKQYLKEWHIANKERRNKDAIENARKNKNVTNARSRQWYYDNLEKAKEYRMRNSARTRDSQLKKNFGISLNEYNAMVSSRDRRCDICGKSVSELKRALCVDHDHKTGSVRGLLCSRCNTILGYVDDRRDLLQNAIIYLIKTGGGIP